MRIIRTSEDVNNCSWILTDKSGTKYYYGTTVSGRLASNRAIGGGRPIFTWCLERVEDVHGNNIKYAYWTDNSAQGSQIYLSGIVYTGYKNTESGRYSVVFNRDSGNRPDKRMICRSGFKIVTNYRLQEIIVNYNSSMARRYALSYLTGRFNKSLVRLLPRPESDLNYPSDGVEIFIQHNDNILTAQVIGKDNFTPFDFNIDSVNVNAGDEIYFRVNSIDDGKYDVVEWNPVIEYDLNSVEDLTEAKNDPELPLGFDKDELQLDENNQNMFMADSVNDYSLAGNRIRWAALRDGNIRCEVNLALSASLTDDIQVRLIKVPYPEDISQEEKKEQFDEKKVLLQEYELNAAENGSFADILGGSFDVKEGDQLILELSSSSPVDWSSVNLTGQVYYTDEEEEKYELYPNINPFIPYLDKEIYQSYFIASVDPNNPDENIYTLNEDQVNYKSSDMMAYVVKEDMESLRLVWSLPVLGNHYISSEYEYTGDYVHFADNDIYTYYKYLTDRNEPVMGRLDAIPDDYNANVYFTVKRKRAGQEAGVILEFCG